MPRTYKRRTNWGSTPLEEMERAAIDVEGGKSIRSVAKDRNIDRSTLRSYIKKKEVKTVKTVGYSGTAEAKMVFTLEVEKELADHIKKLAEQFHGLTPKKCCELAFQYAQKNNIPVPNNWKEKGFAGRACRKLYYSLRQERLKSVVSCHGIMKLINSILLGRDWFKNFMARHHLSCRMPEATSLGRATAFNKTTVGEFFDNLTKVMDR